MSDTNEPVERNGLWRNDPATPEGKYPIVLRRDGTPLESRYFVMTLKDPATAAALTAYANEAACRGYAPGYVADVRELAAQSKEIAAEDQGLKKPTADPDAPRHRKDNPVVLLWAQSIGNPGA